MGTSIPRINVRQNIQYLNQEPPAMPFSTLPSPVAFLRAMLGENLPAGREMVDYEAWWQVEGAAISAAVDRAGTPHVRMFDRFGQRVDEILYPPSYWHMLKQGYLAGVIWRADVQECLLPPYVLG